MSLVEVEIPEVEYLDPAQLIFDDENPNRMTEKQRMALRESMI